MRRGLRQFAKLALLAPLLTAAAPAVCSAGTTGAAPSAFAQENTLGARDLLERWRPLTREASRRFAIPEAWIVAVMTVESGGRTMLVEGQPITSSAGAMGLMQLMPDTWRTMQQQYGLGADPYDPHDNVLAGAAYLALLYRQHGYPAMFAAYNEGPAGLEGHKRLGDDVPAETTDYVLDIASMLRTGIRRRPGAAGDLDWLLKPDRPHGSGEVMTLVRRPAPPRRDPPDDDDDHDNRFDR